MKKLKKFKRKQSFMTVGLIVLLISTALLGAHFYFSNQSLNEELDKQVREVKASDNSISDLQKQLNALKKELAAATSGPTAAPISSTLSLSDLLPPELKGEPTSDEEPAVEPVGHMTLPRIHVEPSVLDLGTIRQADGVVKGNFKITNMGGSELKIYSTFSSCGCTVVPLKNKIIAPGVTIDLAVEYDPNYFRGYLGLGNIEKRITIISNDNSNPFYKVYLKANVIP